MCTTVAVIQTAPQFCFLVFVSIFSRAGVHLFHACCLVAVILLYPKFHHFNSFQFELSGVSIEEFSVLLRMLFMCVAFPAILMLSDHCK
jgi:hypothetical protein